MNYYIGADLGTSALKLLLTDKNGKIINSISKKYPIYYPNPGWSEQAPDDWWDTFVSGVCELTSTIDKKSIKGIGLGGQMHGLVMLDKDDKVIRPAILWNDGRTGKETDYLNTVIGKDSLTKYTANIAFAGFTAPKILWCRENEPENFKAASKIMLPKDFINYRLTGICATDFSDASGMLLLDVENKCWSREMLDVCGISEDKLPLLFESFDVIGTLLPEVANALGLNPDVKVVAGAGDNAASAIGAGVNREGMCNISLGTSGTVFIPSNSFSKTENAAIHNFCHANGKYHLMGCILSAASCNSWFCEEILKTSDFKTEESAITEEMLGENNVYFLPYLMGERSPINDTDARALFIGMSADTKRCDMLQAVLEGVAFAVRDCVDQVRALGVTVSESLLVGGGAKSSLWQNIIANVLNIPIVIPTNREGPAMGGALLASFACGDSDFNKIPVEKEKTVYPNETIVLKYEKKYQKFKKIYPTLKSLYKDLKEDF